jgi:hypothetical protein
MFVRYLIGAWAVLLGALMNVPAIAQDRPQDYHRALSAAVKKSIVTARGSRTCVASYWHACMRIRLIYRRGAKEPFGV